MKSTAIKTKRKMREIILNERPVKIWTDYVDERAMEQIENLTTLPFLYHHLAMMPDVHAGKGMPIGGVLACKNVLRKLLPKHEIISPDVPVDPLEAKVWLNGKQGWIDNDGKFTIQKDEAAYGSWYDYSK